jgi:cell division protein FtsB
MTPTQEQALLARLNHLDKRISQLFEQNKTLQNEVDFLKQQARLHGYK